MHGRAQQGHGAAQLYYASGVTALVDHLINARGAQPRMLVQSLANELHIGIGDTGAQQLGAVEAIRFDGVTNGVRVNVKFACDGAYFPVFGVKVTANLDMRFRSDHLFSLPKRGIRGKGSTNRLLRPQTMQRRNGADRINNRRCTKSVAELAKAVTRPDADVPQPDFGGEEIGWEP
jgi:hypothetical protein